MSGLLRGRVGRLLEPLEADFDDRYGPEWAAPSRAELAEIRKVLLRTEIRDAVTRELFDEWVAVIAERTGTDPQVDLYPKLVAAVVRAVGDAAAEAYVAADPPVPIPVLMRQAFAHVATGLPAPTEPRHG